MSSTLEAYVVDRRLLAVLSACSNDICGILCVGGSATSGSVIGLCVEALSESLVWLSVCRLAPLETGLLAAAMLLSLMAGVVIGSMGIGLSGCEFLLIGIALCWWPAAFRAFPKDENE